MLRWGIGTWFSSAAGVGETHDFPISVARDWDERLNTLLGSNLFPLTVPYPGTRTSLDDDVGTGGLAGAGSTPWYAVIGNHLISGPSLAGGRRNQVIIRDQKYRVVLGIDYHQHGTVLSPFQAPTPVWVNKGSQELLPVLMQGWARTRGYKLATTQEGLVKVHPSELAVAVYNDNACRILSEIQRHFLEPVIDDGKTWQLWTQEEVWEVLHLRIQRFIYESEVFRKEALRTTASGSVRKPTDLLKLRRVEWEYEDRHKNPRGLTRIDLRVADQGYPGWEATTGEPNSFVEEPSPRSLDVTTVPPPDASGVLGMRYVPLAEMDDGECPTFPIPRMFSWAVKWGVVADLLKKEGEANDPVRSEAAEELFQLGVKLARALLGDENG